MSATEKGINTGKWIRIAFINLLIIALLGVVMRYKIAYYLPFIEQKNFLYAHSHFAFTGWVTQVLMVLMVACLNNYLPAIIIKKYKWLITANLLCAYGMLISFPFEGYGITSIALSTLSILVSYLFAIMFWIDLNKIQEKIISKYWFKAALLLSVLSSAGAFFLGYMMASKSQHPTWFMAANYYFLHFQYNGWFFFSCMGLLSEHLKSVGFSLQKEAFWLFALACIPAYFLSALWLPIPLWVYIIVVLAAVAQLLGWTLMLKTVFKRTPSLFNNISNQTKWLFIFSATALSIKLLLQLGSTIPFLSKLAFGFRPVVIGYLHLMFLGVISLFILGYCKMNEYITTNRLGTTGITIFIAGIFLNEIFLMIQGFSYMNYISIPWINELLLGAAFTMFLGILFLNLGITKKLNYGFCQKQKGI